MPFLPLTPIKPFMLLRQYMIYKEEMADSEFFMMYECVTNQVSWRENLNTKNASILAIWNVDWNLIL